MRHLLIFALLCGAALAAERDVTVTGADGLALGGTLACPDAARGPRPAVLLVHGSGPNDRDETIPGGMTATGAPEKILKPVSDALVAAGYVVLRYDKRGAATGGDYAAWEHGPAHEIYNKAGLSDFVSDARAALDVLRAQPEVDRARVLILGHSEGTLIAPTVARADGHVAGLVLMGAMARNLRETLGYQVGERGRKFAWAFVDRDHDGGITPEEMAASDCSGVAGFPADPAAIRKMFAVLDRDRNGRLDRDELDPFFESRVLEGANRTATKWIREHYAAEPNVDHLHEFAGPILVLEGLADEQTLPVETRMLELSFEVRGQRNLEARFFEGLGHGFSPPWNGRVPTVGPVDPKVLASLAGWMGEKFPVPAGPPPAGPAAPRASGVRLRSRPPLALPDDPGLRVFLGR